jgi:diadenosine tetraphosphate (Ap4A) HIT family hydrolase
VRVVRRRRRAAGGRSRCAFATGDVSNVKAFVLPVINSLPAVFPGQQEQTYYQDALLACHLETYPRGVGHTIQVSRTHDADTAEMPIDLGCRIVRVIHAVVNALKRVVSATKVYMHTMCSGELSHLHFQFIPRRPGDLIRGRVFAAERGVLTDYHGLLEALREEGRVLIW